MNKKRLFESLKEFDSVAGEDWKIALEEVQNKLMRDLVAIDVKSVDEAAHLLWQIQTKIEVLDYLKGGLFDFMMTELQASPKSITPLEKYQEIVNEWEHSKGK